MISRVPYKYFFRNGAFDAAEFFQLVGWVCSFYLLILIEIKHEMRAKQTILYHNNQKCGIATQRLSVARLVL